MTSHPLPHDPPLIRLRSPREVLAAVPRLLGYRPHDSIVFLNSHPRAGVSTMRLDLPQGVSPEVEKRLITSMAGMLCKVPEVRRTLLVVYAEGPFGADGDVPRAGFVRALLARLLDSGFTVHDALCVADDGWGAYDGRDGGVRHPLAELEGAAPGELGEAPVAESIEDLAALPKAGFLARRAFASSLARELHARELFRPVAEAEAALEIAPEDAPSDALAALLTVLMCSDFRDAALFTWAWGPDRGLELLELGERIAGGEVGPGDDTIALDLMGLGRAEPPSRERVARAIALVARIAALAPDEVAHVPLTVLAWLHWSQGRGSIAGRLVGRARELDPGYGLAELLDTVLGNGMLPEWAYSRPVS